MNRVQLIRVFENVLNSVGFQKKGNTWIIKGSEIDKGVNLQKSRFGNYYYVNYGYIIRRISLGDLMFHVSSRLVSDNTICKANIENLLDLDFDMADEKRTIAINELINALLQKHILVIDSEISLKNMLIERSHLNNIPIVVKKYFGIDKVNNEY